MGKKKTGGSKEKFTADMMIAAIPGSSGIISAIAKKVGCDWTTVKKKIDSNKKVREAYDAECEINLDAAESVVATNIKMASAEQANYIKAKVNKQVDSADAKWYLSKKGKDRGYGDKTEIEHSGEVSSPVTIVEIVRPTKDDE